MIWPRPLRASQRPALFGAAITTLLGLLFLFPPLGDLARNLSYDLPFLFRPDAEVSEVVVVSMDDTSHGQLGQVPGQEWHRLLHARAIDELRAQGARAIVFDVLITDPWANKSVSDKAREILTNRFDFAPANLAPEAVDAILSNTVARSAAEGFPVVFASVIERASRGFQESAPDRILGGHVLYGSSQFNQRPGRVIRGHNADTSPPSLAWMVANALGRAPPVGDPNRWINYYGPPRTFTYIPYANLFAGVHTGALVSNRVVFIGNEPVLSGGGRTYGDEHPTPYTLWKGTQTPGAEIQATAFLNLHRGEWLMLISPGGQFLLVLVFGLVAGAGLALVRPWIAARLALAGILLCAAAGVVLVWSTRHWIPWVTLAGVQLPVALAWSVVANTKRLYKEKAVLEESLATARTGHPSPAEAPERNGLAGRPAWNLPHPASPSPLAEEAGPLIPDHTLVRRIGRGAYGEVWLARDIIGTHHAVKVVHRKGFSSDSPYLREFRGLQKFTPISRQHPGLVQVLHVGRNEQAGYFYCIMELGDDAATGQVIHADSYLPRTLARELDERGRLPASECVQLGLALAEALDFLHRHRLIHRDIKPSNIIYVHGLPKFADVGLVTDLVTQTRSDITFLGTEGFIAPEGPGTAAADVFSLGKLLYEAGMGRDRQQFPELPSALDDLPDQELLLELNSIILKACETEVGDRYQSAAELARDLAALQAGF